MAAVPPGEVCASRGGAETRAGQRVYAAAEHPGLRPNSAALAALAKAAQGISRAGAHYELHRRRDADHAASRHRENFLINQLVIYTGPSFLFTNL